MKIKISSVRDALLGSVMLQLSRHKAEEPIINLLRRKDGNELGQIFVTKLEDSTKMKSKVCNSQSDAQRCPQSPIKISDVKSVPLKRNKVKFNNNKESTKKENQVKVSQNHANARENTIKLLLHSNMCLFKSLRTKYKCYACNIDFKDVSLLREHTVTHNLTYLAQRVNKLRGLSYYSVDISDLQCKSCSQSCVDLTDLKIHLANQHGVQFSNSEHFLIPYRLKNGHRCVLCEEKFNSFLRLSIHMHSHYAHNVCEICGQPFINRKSLRLHLSSLHTKKKCTLCSNFFSNNATKIQHMKKVHNLGGKTPHHRCNQCEKTFRYTSLLYEHIKKEHNIERPVAKCSDCGKTFLGQHNLKVHTRSVHKKERNYACTICGTRFFTKCDQKRHERTHDDMKSFSCGYCDTKFKSNDSRRRHLKRQHGHMFGA